MMGWTDAQRGKAAAGIVLGLAFAAVAPLPGAAASRDRELQEPISYDAAWGDLDYKNKTGDFKNIVVTQGKTRIQADRAHAVGLDEEGFQDGRWTFQGNVRIDAEPRGQLRSDEAVVEFRDKRIATATATGRPAEFQQRRASTGEITRGHAELIVYDVGTGNVRLSKDAWLTLDGRNEISGPVLVYNIKDQHIQAEAGKGHRVHAIIVPQGSQNGPGKNEPGKQQIPPSP
jgi:lipopolysaccharide export system protein LptA